VDDAIFLMGKSLVRQGEHDKGIRKFQELSTNFPESEYIPPSYYWLALASYEKRDYNQAISYADRFLEKYPDHDIRFEMMFLAGDVHLAMENHDEALAFYSGIAEEADKGELVDRALLSSARLYYGKEEWESAAASYDKILRKGMKWESYYDVSLSLADCHAKTGECEEALEIYDGLIERITKTKEKPPVVLGRGDSYLCMDSLETAVSIYRSVTRNYPRSDYSAEAYYKLGTIYHEKMDSLEQAQKAYSLVSTESSGSMYATESLQKAASLKKLIELGEGTGGEDSEDRLAEKRFLTAEIQLTKLGETELALENYRAVIDSFPRSRVGPRATYAAAWIYWKKLDDNETALGEFIRLVERYPTSFQARGALEQIGSLGDRDTMARLAAFVDSAVVDSTARAEQLMEAQEAARDSLAMQDSTVTDSTTAPDTIISDVPTPHQKADSLRRRIPNMPEVKRKPLKRDENKIE
jgi:TolA-binding protein